MGGAQAAKVMDIVNRGKLERAGQAANEEALKAMSDALQNRLDKRVDRALRHRAAVGRRHHRSARHAPRARPVPAIWPRSRRPHAATQHLRRRPFLNQEPRDEVHPRARADRRHRDASSSPRRSTRTCAEWEAAQQFPATRCSRSSATSGLLGIKYPTDYGGMGLDFSYSMVMAEALGDVQLRRRADGHRRADRHGHAGAGALRLGRAASASSSRRPSPATTWPASASARPAAAPTWPR